MLNAVVICSAVQSYNNKHLMLRKMERLGFQELKAFLAGRQRPSSAQLSYNTNSSFSSNIFSAEAAGLCEETTGAAGLLFLWCGSFCVPAVFHF